VSTLARFLFFQEPVVSLSQGDVFWSCPSSVDLRARSPFSRLVAALAALAQATGRDLAGPDWWRLLDALLLITAHPAAL